MTPEEIKPATGNIGNPFEGMKPSTGLRHSTKDEIQMSAAEFDSQLAIMDYQNQYNYAMELDKRAYETPEAQARRMRAAGLNPDLLGLPEQTAGSPTSATPSPVSADLQAANANDISRNQMFAQDFAQLTQIGLQAISTYKGYQLGEMQLGMLKNQLGNKNYGDIVNYLSTHPDTFKNYVVTDPDGTTHLDESKIVSSEDHSDLFEQIMHRPYNEASASEQQIFAKNLLQARRDLASQIGLNNNQAALASSQVNKQYQQEISQQVSNAFVHDMVEIKMEAQMNTVRAENQAMRYRDAIYKELEPETAAKVINCQNKNQLEYLMTIDPELAALNDNEQERVRSNWLKAEETKMSVLQSWLDGMKKQYEKYKQGKGIFNDTMAFAFGKMLLGSYAPTSGLGQTLMNGVSAAASLIPHPAAKIVSGGAAALGGTIGPEAPAPNYYSDYDNTWDTIHFND